LGATVDLLHLLTLLSAEIDDVAVGLRIIKVQVAEAVAEAGDALGPSTSDNGRESRG